MSRWITSLPALFEHIGFVDVKIHKTRERPDLRLLYMDLILLRVHQQAAELFDRQGEYAGGETYRERGRKAMGEAQWGTSISEIHQVVVGRKPLGSRSGSESRSESEE